ncbi:MAG: prepilin-type N-terminal cleavage/methylation domain-containing protein [Myxococcota bacterium]|nr:prepilin-type N-terminal cleavage/methylation domain-containing protein [Myxococcota bacterium]
MISPRPGLARGFTLMEMMIALLIGAIVVSPLYIVTRSMSQQTDVQRMDVEAMQRARLGMDAIIRDFSRTGSFVCVNTETDALCGNRDISSSHAQWRSAVAHLNRGQTGFDAVLIAGNFLGGVDNFQDSSWYTGVIVGGNQIQFPDTNNFTELECVRQFDPTFAFAHIKTTIDVSLDAKVTDAEFNNGNCVLTVREGDLNDRILASGDLVYVSANQTALFWVESLGDRNVLVRYFVDFMSPNAASSDCTAEGAATVSEITLPGDSYVVESTRTVIADYVEDFQVWFRPTSPQGDPAWIAPHHYPIRGGAGIVDEKSGNFSNGFFLADAAYVFPRNAGDDPAADLDDISCAEEPDRTYGAEHVRSAVVRLSVRTEMTDQAIEFDAFDPSQSRIARYTLGEYHVPDGGTAKTKPGTAYRLKTLITEVAMPNLAAQTRVIEP